MHKILFLTLKMFSSTGGIEKMNRIVAKALYETGYGIKIYSSHDEEKIENKYFPSAIFSPFSGNKIRFTLKSIQEGIRNNVVILSHINLLMVGYLIKIFSPKTKLVLFAHGVEIWKPLSSFKKKMLSKCDRVFAVSNFTNDTIQQLGYVKKGQSVVLNNCLDPFLQKTGTHGKPSELLTRYGLTDKNFILLTISRLSSEEKYKGYDIVLGCLQSLIIDYPHLRYLIIGKYDDKEKQRMDTLIDSMNLKDAVIFGGFIPEEELGAHYQLADLYVMPSIGEGFGIVFIEAMYYGLPVIAGNKDGSTDALLNGKLGLLVNPGKPGEITAAIKKVIDNKAAFQPDHNVLMNRFGYNVYKQELEMLLKNVMN